MKDRFPYNLYRALWVVADWVFPPECAGCGKPGFRFCQECQSQIELLDRQICPICGAPLDTKKVCRVCARSRPSFEMLRSYALYRDPLRKAIHHLKYKQDMALASFLADKLIVLIADQLKWQFDLVTSVPLNRERINSRGYNQSNLIAFPIALAFGVPFLPRAVRRVRNTLSQVGLSVSQRTANVQGAFEAEKHFVDGKTILLVDDVVTTGATIASCSASLMQSGAAKVFCVSVAKTPVKTKSDDKINEMVT